MTQRITYVSRFAKPMDTHQLEALGEAAAARNRELGITGILMASGGMFYQILEGPKEAVAEIYSAIANDPRHTDLVLLRSEEDVSARLFPEWSMKTVNLDAASHVRLLPLKALVKAVYEQQRLIDNMIWSIERTTGTTRPLGAETATEMST